MSRSDQNDNRHPLAGLDKVAHGAARLMILTSLYVVQSAEYLSLINITGLTWGNLATHLKKLEETGYVEVEKEIRGKKVYSMVHLTSGGRESFRAYKEQMKTVLNDLPD